jgi:hypothetical protein
VSTSSPSPDSKGLRLGRHRLSDYHFRILFLRFVWFSLICLLIVYIGLVAMGRTRGFAYLVANHFGDRLGDSLTADKSRLSPSLQSLEVLNLRSITNRNQKVVYTRIAMVSLDLDWGKVGRAVVSNMSCDVVFQPDGNCSPSGMAFLSRLPLLNRLDTLPRKKVAKPSSADALTSAEAEVDQEEADLKKSSLRLEDLPPFEVIDSSIRLKSNRGELFAEIDDLDIRWTPASASSNQTARLSLRMGYVIPKRTLPRQVAEVVVQYKDGRFDVEKLEAETPLLLEVGKYLEGLRTPPLSPIPAGEEPQNPALLPLDGGDSLPPPDAPGS